MRRLPALLKIAFALLTVVWISVSSVEARKEVRILCGTFAPGKPLERVLATLETGNFLHYRLEPADAPQRIVVRSYYDGLGSVCNVVLADSLVQTSTYETRAYLDALFGE